MVDFHCYAGGTKWFKEDMARSVSPDLMYDLLFALMVKKDTGFKTALPWVADPSAYFVGSRKKVE
jgi:hypothetical protein